MSGATVLVQHLDGVAVIALNRPDAGNTITMDMALEFERTVETLVADDSVRCLVLTGNGKLFCGGGDVAAMGQAGTDASGYLFALAMALHRSVEKLAAMAKPLVVVVNGPAAGAGLSLAIAGDVVLASPRAHFTAAYGTVGLTPDGGMSWLLPRLVGLRRAQEIILTNRRIGAQEAGALGLITRVVEEANLRDEGLAVAQALAAGPMAAIGGARALLAAGMTSDLPGHLQAEARRIAEAGAGAEAKEGVSAFVERRKPDFRKGTGS